MQPLKTQNTIKQNKSPSLKEKHKASLVKFIELWRYFHDHPVFFRQAYQLYRQHVQERKALQDFKIKTKRDVYALSHHNFAKRIYRSFPVTKASHEEFKRRWASRRAHCNDAFSVIKIDAAIQNQDQYFTASEEFKKAKLNLFDYLAHKLNFDFYSSSERSIVGDALLSRRELEKINSYQQTLGDNAERADRHFVFGYWFPRGSAFPTGLLLENAQRKIYVFDGELVLKYCDLTIKGDDWYYHEKPPVQREGHLFGDVYYQVNHDGVVETNVAKKTVQLLHRQGKSLKYQIHDGEQIFHGRHIRMGLALDVLRMVDDVALVDLNSAMSMLEVFTEQWALKHRQETVIQRRLTAAANLYRISDLREATVTLRLPFRSPNNENILIQRQQRHKLIEDLASDINANLFNQTKLSLLLQTDYAYLLNYHYHGLSLLATAVKKKSTKFSQQMIEYGADVNAKVDGNSLNAGYYYGDNCLILAVRNNDMAHVKMLVRSGANVVACGVLNYQSAYNALSLAMDNKYFHIENLLLAYGARNPDGTTPIKSKTHFIYKSDLVYVKNLSGGSHATKLYKHLYSGELWVVKEITNDSATASALRDNVRDVDYLLDLTANEFVISKLYQLANVDMPEGRLAVFGDKIFYASRYVEKFKADPARLKNPDEKVTGLFENFLVDVWLGNFDVVGADFENIGFVGDKAMRIDSGAGGLYRAQGMRKADAHFSDDGLITYHDMLNPKVNAAVSRVFSKVNQAQIAHGVGLINAISDAVIHQTVMEFGSFDPKLSELLSKRLINRKRSLQKMMVPQKLALPAKPLLATPQELALPVKPLSSMPDYIPLKTTPPYVSSTQSSAHFMAGCNLLVAWVNQLFMLMTGSNSSQKTYVIFDNKILRFNNDLSNNYQLAIVPYFLGCVNVFQKINPSALANTAGHGLNTYAVSLNVLKQNGDFNDHYRFANVKEVLFHLLKCEISTLLIGAQNYEYYKKFKTFHSNTGQGSAHKSNIFAKPKLINNLLNSEFDFEVIDANEKSITLKITSSTLKHFHVEWLRKCLSDFIKLPETLNDHFCDSLFIPFGVDKFLEILSQRRVNKLSVNLLNQHGQVAMAWHHEHDPDDKSVGFATPGYDNLEPYYPSLGVVHAMNEFGYQFRYGCDIDSILLERVGHDMAVAIVTNDKFSLSSQASSLSIVTGMKFIPDVRKFNSLDAGFIDWNKLRLSDAPMQNVPGLDKYLEVEQKMINNIFEKISLKPYQVIIPHKFSLIKSEGGTIRVADRNFGYLVINDTEVRLRTLVDALRDKTLQSPPIVTQTKTQLVLSYAPAIFRQLIGALALKNVLAATSTLSQASAKPVKSVLASVGMYKQPPLPMTHLPKINTPSLTMLSKPKPPWIY